MPALSPTMTQGNIGAWRKKAGDGVEPGDVLVEIETDKAQMDFESPEEGFIAKLLVESGTKDVPINQPIAVLVEDASHVDAFADYTVTAAAPAPSTVEAPKTKEAPVSSPLSHDAGSGVGSGDRLKSSPLAKTLAAKLGIDLNLVKGTGPAGRITKADVENYQPSTSSPPAATPSVLTSATTAAAATSTSTNQSYKDLPLTNMRKVIATRLTQSKVEIPHFYITVDVNMENILRLRQVLNEAQTEKLSVNDFVVKACALALRKVPEVNSAWHQEFIRQYENVDISVATATPTGLITPIVTDADKKGLSVISSQIKQLVARARANELKPHEYQGGTFTISNLGMFGVDQFTAIINPPQASILAVGSTKKQAVVNSEGQVIVQDRMKVSLSCDHRVVDGAVGAQWLSVWRDIMENPLKMLL